MADRLEKIFETYRMNPSDAAKKSKVWFEQQMMLLNSQKVTHATLMKNRPEMSMKSRIIPGSMYLFQYDPLHADSLQYYDSYPLVIPFRQVQGGFFGLNLHYLHPKARVMLLDSLMSFATDKNLDEDTKLKFTWQVAAHAAKNKFIASCVKHYLIPQVQSQFMKINPPDWAAALMIPCESFVGASKQHVWAESRRI